jgi:hypothetical protein
MSQKLVDRAEAVRAKFRVLEGTQGTGHHDNDRNSVRPEIFSAPQRNGMTRASDNLVAFFDHDEEVVYFMGPDAGRALDVLHQWRGRFAGGDVAGLPGSERKLVLRIIPRLAVTTVADDVPCLAVWLSDWNDVLLAIQAEGVGVSGLTLDPAGTT